MAKKPNPADALAHVFCNYPGDTGPLSPKELAALHLCKHEMVAALYRYYTIVPPKKGTRGLMSAFQKLMAALD